MVTSPSPGPGVGGGVPPPWERRERESSLADPHGGPAATDFVFYLFAKIIKKICASAVSESALWETKNSFPLKTRVPAGADLPKTQEQKFFTTVPFNIAERMNIKTLVAEQ